MSKINKKIHKKTDRKLNREIMALPSFYKGFHKNQRELFNHEVLITASEIADSFRESRRLQATFRK